MKREDKESEREVMGILQNMSFDEIFHSLLSKLSGMSEPYIGPFTFCLSRTHSICNEFSKCATKTLKAKRKKKDKSIP